MLKINKYSRNSAVEYALKYALIKNPEFFDYTNMGGNCTNYISQCVYAGAPKMNFSQNGWYYLSPSNTSISWANVEPFYNFLISNTGEGPYASVGSIITCEVGDVIQLKFSGKSAFSHSLIITEIKDRSKSGIYVCANTVDVLNRSLSSYNFSELRVLHILGYRS